MSAPELSHITIATRDSIREPGLQPLYTLNEDALIKSNPGNRHSNQRAANHLAEGFFPTRISPYEGMCIGGYIGRDYVTISPTPARHKVKSRRGNTYVSYIADNPELPRLDLFTRTALPDKENRHLAALLLDYEGPNGEYSQHSLLILADPGHPFGFEKQDESTTRWYLFGRAIGTVPLRATKNGLNNVLLRTQRIDPNTLPRVSTPDYFPLTRTAQSGLGYLLQLHGLLNVSARDSWNPQGLAQNIPQQRHANRSRLNIVWA